jgi:hypothetical protein
MNLTELRHDARVRGRRRLGERIASVDIEVISRAYRSSIEQAPHRRDRGKKYLVPAHDGGGDHGDRSREKVAAKAMFNGQALADVAEGFELIDYEVPLRARRGDAGIGEIDLLGLAREARRLWVVEVKVEGNAESPLEALIQALSYAAIVEGNRAPFAAEVATETGIDIIWPPAIAVVADKGYWTSLARSRGVGPWTEAMQTLVRRIRDALAIDVRFVDVGDLSWTVDAEGRARLAHPPEIRPVF